MPLEIEYNQKKYQADAGKNSTIDDFQNGIHVRASGHKDGGYVGISNAKPEGEKNGPKYCEVGFYVKTQNNNPLDTTETFMGRKKLFEIKIRATSSKTKKDKV